MGVADTKRSVRASSSPPLRTGSGSSTLINVFARLVAWYLLYTVLFRCPEVPTNGSPTICHTTSTVLATLRPHLEPYYNQYVEPHVSEYSPHLRKANENYLVPAYDKATYSYQQYAAPHVSRTRDYVSKGYNRAVKPRVDEVSSKAKVYYDEYLSSHVAKGEQIYTIAQPHLSKAQKTVGEAFRGILVPAYVKVLPYAVRVYENIWHVIVTIVAPMVRQNGEKAVYWGVGIWSDVVRPQVGRIGERLGGTGNGTPAASVPGSIPPAAEASKAIAVSSSLASVSSSASAGATSAKSSALPSAASAAEDGSQNTDANDAKELTPEEVQVIIEEDLTSWTRKFKGSQAKTIDDLNEKIGKISAGARAKKSSYVEKEITALENLIDVEFEKIRKTTIEIASGLSPESDAGEKQAALDSLFATTRDAGIKIRDKAQEQRLESQMYLAGVYDDVAAAADNSLEIFDSVLDLSMQELGMKWAWMDHVSYKAWRRYHAMKKDFDGLKREVVTAAQGNQKLVEITRWIESDWEGKATDIAKDAAEELKRLKRVSKEKIELVDSLDDFSDSIPPVVVERLGQQVLKKVGEAKEVTPGESEKGQLGKVHAAEDAEEAAETTSMATIRTEHLAAESAANIASENTSNAADEASEEVYGTEEPTLLAPSASPMTETVQARVPGGVNAGFVGASRVEYEQDPDEAVSESVRIFDTANEKLADASHAVSEALAGATTTQAAIEKYASAFSEDYESALSAASSALYGTPQPARESLVSIATDKYSAAVAAASSAIYGTPTPKAELFVSQASEAYEHALTAAKDEYRKAMRRFVTMVYPEDLPPKGSAKAAASENYNEALTAAENKYSSLLSQASSAQARYDRVIQQAQASYQSAVGAASTAIYGTPQPAAENVLNVAKERYQQALKEAEKTFDSWYSVASTAVSPLPTPTAVIISSKLVKAAENVASAASEAVYGTPQPFTESVAYFAGEYVSAASDAAENRYESVKAFISELVSGKEPAYTESVISRLSSLMYGTQAPIIAKATSAVGEVYDSASTIAVENYESATSIVRESYGSVTSAICNMATPPPALESVISAANEQYQAAIAAASVQVYGTTQGTAESISSIAGEAYKNAQSAVTEAIYGRQTGAFESATLRMQEAAELAQRAVSEVVYGTSKGTFESTTSVIGENYAAATEAVAEGLGAAGSVVGESYEQAQARISATIHCPQQDIVEKAQSRISEAAERAKSSLSVVIYGTQPGYVGQAASSVSSAASAASAVAEEVVGDATKKVKEAYSARDEL